MHADIQHAALESCPRRVSGISEGGWEEDTHRTSERAFEESHSDAELGDTGDSEEPGHTDFDCECGGRELSEDDEVDQGELE